jgi:glycosyltransferase involved in cell wall biosynthesis
MPKVSILLATAGRPKAILETLGSLAEVPAPTHYTTEVLVIENGGRTQLEDHVRRFDQHRFSFRYIHCPQPNKSNALNVGLKAATGDYLLFTDDDVRFPPNWIRDMVFPLEDGSADIVVGGCKIAPHLMRTWMSRDHRGLLASTEFLNEGNMGNFAGVNFSARRQVFEVVPGFDCELGGGGLGNGEDTLIAYQLSRAGFRFCLRTSIAVEHHFAPDRLYYPNWVRACNSLGRSNAYLSYHWRHEDPSWPRARLLYLQAKLHLRLLLTRLRRHPAEGIPRWELCYRTDIATLLGYLRERKRPRHYRQFGLHKSPVDRSDPPGKPST